MKAFIETIKNETGLSILLVFFLLVEGSNFESMFFKFMLQFRPDWGAFNHVAATFLSAGILSAIVIYGLREEALISWGLAFLAVAISLGVYSQINTISWTWGSWGMENIAVVILGVIIPLMVAHTTHSIVRGRKKRKQASVHLINAQIAMLEEQAAKMSAPPLQRYANTAATQPPPVAPLTTEEEQDFFQ